MTRALVESGFFTGEPDDVLGPAPSNPTGHYEPLAVLELNEALLADHGSSWWAEPPTDELDLPATEEARSRARAALEQLIEEADGSPVVLKEPRINGLLDFWGPAVEDHLHPVLVVRNPIEVALSLGRRDGNPLPQALAAWEVQTTGALQWADGREVTVAHYSDLSGADDALVAFDREVTAHLAPERAARVDPDHAAGSLDPALRNQRADDVDLDEHLTVRQRALWDFLAALPPGDQRLAVPAGLLGEPRAALEVVRAEGDRLAVNRRLKEATARAYQVGADLARVEGERQAATATAAAVMYLSIELDHHKRELQRMLGVAEGSRQDLAGRLAEAERRGAELEARRADLESRLAGVEASLSWKLTRPLRKLKSLGR